MPGKRKITGTKPLFGQSRSKAFNTVKRQVQAEPAEQTHLRARARPLGARQDHGERDCKTIDKIGFMEFLKRRNIPLKQLL